LNEEGIKANVQLSRRQRGQQRRDNDQMSDVPEPPPPQLPEQNRGFGKFADLNRECRNILQAELWEGGKFEYTRHLSPTFTVSHLVNMMTDLPPSYIIAPTLMKEIKSRNFFSVFSGQLSPDLSGFVQVLLKKGKNQLSLFSQVIDSDKPSVMTASKPVIFKAEYEFGGNEAARFSSYSGDPLVTLSFLNPVTQTLALGGSFSYFHQENLTLPSGGFRYHSDPSQKQFPRTVWSGQLSANSLVLSHVREIEPKLSLCVESLAAMNPKNSSLESVTSIGMENRFTQTTFKGGIDTSGRIFTKIDHYLFPTICLSLCGEINPQRNDYRFGLGLNVNV